MTATETGTTTRRAALAALALSVPFAGTIAAAISTPAKAATFDRTAWDQAFATYQRAKAASEAHDAITEPHIARFRAEVAANPNSSGAERAELWGRIVPRHLDDEGEVLGEAHYEAAKALVTIPAPDGPAFLWKLEYLWGGDDEGDGYGASYSGAWMAAIMADARRLLSVGRA